MKRWIKHTLIGIFGATALLGGLTAWAHNHHDHRWTAMSEEDAAAMKTRVVETVGKRLDLDNDQKAKLATLADKLREQRNALIAGTDPRTEMQSLVAGTAFDRARATALIEAKVGAVKLKSPEVVAAMADFYDSLKPAQQAKVRDFMARRRGQDGRG